METSNPLQANQLQPRSPCHNRYDPGLDDKTWPSGTSRSSTDLPQAAWVRQASPRLVSSFQLIDEQEWDVNELPSRDVDMANRGLVDAMTLILQCFGWLPQSGGQSSHFFFQHLRFLVSLFLLNVVVVVLTIHAHLQGAGGEKGEYQKLEHVDSLARHCLLSLAHVFMYTLGGSNLTEAFRAADFRILPFQMVLLGICLVVYWVCDVVLMHHLLQAGVSVWSLEALRRFLIVIGRLPTAVAVILMMGIPKAICQDLVQVDKYLEHANIPEAQRIYCIFWKHLRTARRWYNAIMTPNFLAAIARLPVGCYALIHKDDLITGDNYDEQFEIVFLVFRSALDIAQLLIWVQPAIQIRMNHGVVLSLAVEKAGQQTPKARELATMMASLHPLVGLKFLGFIVTWRLVTQVATLVPFLLAALTFYLKRK